MRNLIALAAAAIISSVSACGLPPPAPIRLSLPPPLDLPKIRTEALQCLTDDAYSAIVLRDVKQRERIKTLEDIIRATQ